MNSAELQARLMGRTYTEEKPKNLTSSILKERIEKYIITSGIKVEGASLKTDRRKLESK